MVKIRMTLSDKLSLTPEELTRNRNNIGLILKMFRERNNILQNQIAEKLGYVNLNFISMVETGKSSVPLARLEEFQKAYGAPAELIPIMLKYLYPETWNIFLLSLGKCKDLFGTDKKASTIDKTVEKDFKALLKEAKKR